LRRNCEKEGGSPRDAAPKKELGRENMTVEETAVGRGGLFGI